MSNQINGGGTAFPVADSWYPDGQVQFGSNGMTLRDYFAGQALTGMMDDIITMDAPERARYAYYQADAMLKAREEVAK